MLVLEIVLLQLLLACAFALVCTLQLCLHAFALRAGNWPSALHIQVEHILGEGQRGPIGSSLPSSSFYLWLIGLLTSIMDMWAASVDQGSHEEADTSDLVHLFHSLQSSSLEMVHTVA